MTRHEYSVGDDGWVKFRTVRPEPGRKYFNHLAKHTSGEWHRHWLLSSGMYIKTSQTPGAGLMQFVRGPLPEYKPGRVRTGNYPRSIHYHGRQP